MSASHWSRQRNWACWAKNILGSGFDFEVELHFDVGIFVSGESSALMRSIEGNAPEPRPKYIRTSVSGIWDKPSNLNNVETWANVPERSSTAARTGTPASAPKEQGHQACVALRAMWSTAAWSRCQWGMPLRTIVFDIGGGVPEGRAPKAIHFGGAMGGSIPISMIDAPLDFDGMSKLGAPIGAGGLLVMDEDTDMVEIARYLLDFLVKESCGKCTPCREGMYQMLKILTDIIAGRGRKFDLERLADLIEVTSLGSLCALGKTSSDPLKSMLRYFKPEFEARIAAGSAAGSEAI